MRTLQLSIVLKTLEDETTKHVSASIDDNGVVETLPKKFVYAESTDNSVIVSEVSTKLISDGYIFDNVIIV